VSFSVSWLAQRPRLNLDPRERTSAGIMRLIDAGLAESGVVSDLIAVLCSRLSIWPKMNTLQHCFRVL
jgi:hypothetical protein